MIVPVNMPTESFSFQNIKIHINAHVIENHKGWILLRWSAILA